MIKLKVPESKKYEKDGEWFKEIIDHYVPYQLAYQEDYEQRLNSYKIVNNDLSGIKEQLEAFCNPLGIETGEIEEQVIPYPELRNKVNILKGEMLGRKDTFHVTLLTAMAIRDKDEQLKKEIMESVDEKTAIDLQKMELQMQGMSEEEIQKFTEELRTKNEPEDLLAQGFLSNSEIFYNKAIRFGYYNQDILDKQSQTFEDVAIDDRCFVYVGWKYGKPTIQIRNTLNTRFHKNPNERYIQKSDWIEYTQAITPTEAIENYNLSDEDVDKLGIGTTRGLSERHDVIRGKAEVVRDQTRFNMMLSLNKGTHNDKSKGLNESGISTLFGADDLIWETHFEFKAFKEVIFLSYRDEYNKQIVIPLSSTYEIPKKAKKEKFLNRFDQDSERWVWYDKELETEFTAERLWIPRKYEAIRLGADVYPVFREVPYQHTNVEDPFSSFELSTKGAIFNARNVNSVSLVQHAIPAYMQYLYIKHIQNRELSKYQGAIQSIDVDQIPDGLGEDENGIKIKDKVVTYLVYLKKTNKDIYSGSQGTTGALPPSTRSPGSNGYLIGTAVELMNLQQLAELLKREISMAMGISPQREANFVAGSNVSDNQQAINQSYAITEPYFFTHAQIWKAALNEWLIYFRKFCQIQMEVHNLKDLSFNYWLPDGTQETLKVTPEHLSHADIGLQLVNSSINQKYADYMLQQVQAFAQNAGEGISAVSGIIKDIVNGASPEDTHRRIVIEANKQQERQMQMQQQNNDAQMQQQQIQLQMLDKQHEYNLEEIRLKGEIDSATKINVATIGALGFAQDTDVNDNNIPDVVDLQNIALAQSKLQLDIKKQKDDVRLKEEKLQIDRVKANKPTGK